MVPKGLDLELSAMQDMATALGELDPAARARVLNWLQQRFSADAVPVQAAPASPAPAAFSALRIVPQPAPVVDEQLSVETLEELFSPPAPAAPQTVTGMLTEFVAEFQNIAREWDDACAPEAESPRPVRRLSAAF